VDKARYQTVCLAGAMAPSVSDNQEVIRGLESSLAKVNSDCPGSPTRYCGTVGSPIALYLSDIPMSEY